MQKQLTDLLTKLGDADLDIQWQVARSMALTAEAEAEAAAAEESSSGMPRSRSGLPVVPVLEGLFCAPPAAGPELVAQAVAVLARFSPSGAGGGAGGGAVSRECSADMADALIQVFLVTNSEITAIHLSTQQSTILSYFVLDFVHLLQESDYFRLLTAWVQSVMDDLSSSCSLDASSPTASLRIKLGGQLIASRPLTREGGEGVQLLEAIIACVHTASRDRSVIIKALLKPCMAMLLATTSVPAASPGAGGLRCAIASRLWAVGAEELHADPGAGSLLIAVLSQMLAATEAVSHAEEEESANKSFFNRTVFWDVVVTYFLHDDSVVRKRGAFLTEQFLVCYENKIVTTATSKSISAGSTTTATESKGKSKGKSRGKRVRAPAEGAGAGGGGPAEVGIVAAVDTAGVGESEGDIVVKNARQPQIQTQTRHWLHNFLAIYGQIEGCRYIHLVEQVLGHIETLCALLFLSDTPETLTQAVTGAGTGAGTGTQRATPYPPLSFLWVQVVLQCLLRGQLVAIRKHALQLILS
jgi:hypothetical protein